MTDAILIAVLGCFLLLARLLGWGVALSLDSAGRAPSGLCDGFVSLAEVLPGSGSLLGTGLLTDCSRLSPDGAVDADCITGFDTGLVGNCNLLVVPLVGGRFTDGELEMVTPSWARDR